MDCHYSEMEELKHIEDVNWELMAKYLGDEASDSERNEVETWAGQSAENLSQLNSIREIMEKSKLFYQSRRFDPASAWEKIRPELKKESVVIPMESLRKPVWHQIPLLRVAASLLVALMLGTAGFYIGFRQKKATIFTEIVSNQLQVPEEVLLPDGTMVTLNNHSRLTYPKQFTGESREVTITGEAFFEVQPDASRPFIISAGNARIKVLGTSFNVMARPGNETVEVVVRTGKVEVTSHTANPAGRQQVKNSSNLILTPGDKGVLYNTSNQLVKSTNDDPNIIAWKTHELIFNQSKLKDVILDLEKVYHTEIQLSDPDLNDLVYTAHFDNQSIDFILEVIRLTFNMKLSAENGQYFLTAINNHQ